jgi:hypothetical protein
MPVKYVNTTPHTIHLYLEDDSILAVPPTPGAALRCQTTTFELPRGKLGFADVDLPVACVSNYHLDAEQGVPDLLRICEAHPGTVVLCSSIALEAVSDTLLRIPQLLAPRMRESGCRFVAPDTGPKNCVRDEKGQIIGTRCLLTRSALVTCLPLSEKLQWEDKGGDKGGRKDQPPVTCCLTAASSGDVKDE